MCRIVACNRHITQERLPTSRYVFVLRAETAGDTSLLFCLVRIVCTECTFFTLSTSMVLEQCPDSRLRVMGILVSIEYPAMRLKEYNSHRRGPKRGGRDVRQRGRQRPNAEEGPTPERSARFENVEGPLRLTPKSTTSRIFVPYLYPVILHGTPGCGTKKCCSCFLVPGGCIIFPGPVWYQPGQLWYQGVA